MPEAWWTLRRSPAVSTSCQVWPSISTSESTGSVVVPAVASTTERFSPVSWLSRLDLPTFGLPTSATRRGPPSRSTSSRGEVGQHVEHGVEQVARAATVQARHRVRLAEAEAPQRGDLLEAARVVDLRGAQQHRPVRAAQHAGRGLVDRGRADLAVDDQQDRVGGAHRGLGLRGDGGLHALGVGDPAAGVQQCEPPAVPQRVVGDAVAGHAGHVLHDRLAAAEDAVDQRRLADVRAPDDGEHRLGRPSACVETGVVQHRPRADVGGEFLRHFILRSGPRHRHGPAPG